MLPSRFRHGPDLRDLIDRAEIIAPLVGILARFGGIILASDGSPRSHRPRGGFGRRTIAPWALAGVAAASLGELARGGQNSVGG